MKPRGLVLVTGVTGSGKSTALAAMIQHINENRRANVITIEDPIEFLHRDINCHINQREIGTDTATFGQALRRVLRQDPDVILIGEIRDLETLDTALKAADTGHLVFSTLHTTDATQTINRVLSFYPPHQQAEVRFSLASALQAVISLRLVPRADKRRPHSGVRSAHQHRRRARQHPRHGKDAQHSRPHQRGHGAVRNAELRSVAHAALLERHRSRTRARCSTRRARPSSRCACRASPAPATRRGRGSKATPNEHADPRLSRCSTKSSSRTAARSRCASSAPAASSACRRWPSTPRRTASRCTCASPTTTSASARRRRASPISTFRGSSPPPKSPAPTRFIPATGFSPRTRSSPTSARRRRSRSSDRRRDQIRVMGDKAAARKAMTAVGVPIVPGTPGPVEDVDEALEFAKQIGFPVIIKAAAGGGGKGMRVAHDADDFARSFQLARSEALSAFGNGDVYVEKYLARPRHIEFQILGDKFGNVIHLGERDCSVQRRHQKLIEEAPSPGDDARAAAADGHARGRRREGDRLRRRRHDRDAARRGRLVLLHGDEHAHSGRASGDRDAHRRRPREGADPRRGGRAAQRHRAAAAARARHRGAA